MTLRMGLHAPTSGASDAFKQAAANLQASVFTWMALVMKDGSTAPHRPEDARSFPEGTHILRIPTPAPAETPADWMNRVVPLLDVWTSSGIPPGALIVQPGNEPDWPGVDLPVAWGVDAWLGAAHGYRDALKARYPNLPLLAPPLTCARTNALTFDYVQPYEGVAVHCYWSKGNPGWRQGKDGGQAWTCALFGKPIYVTEVGSNPQDAAEIVAWAGEIDSPLVFAATLFIADSAASWPQYNVTPQLAADVRAGLSVQPNPPPPPPPPPPQGYTRDTQPMHTGAAYQSDAWLVAMRGRNPNEADRIVAAYGSCAAALGYDGNLMIAQGWVETAGFTSSRWVNAHNAAGIGIYSDGTLDVQFGTVERGIQAQAGLLSDYFGDGRDPWGVLAEYGFGFATPLGKTKLSDMDGVWAADTGYSAAIVAVANSVTEGIVGPIDPGANLTDLDNRMAAEAMRHVGETRMGPGQPLDDGNGAHTMANWCEAGAETVAAIVTGVRIRFPSAYAHYLALSAAGKIDPDPDTAVAGEFDFWGPYSDGFGHITIRGTDGLTYGTSVVPDVWIGRPPSYYPSYLGHAVSEAVLQVAATWHAQEDDVIPNVTNAWDDGLLQAVWQSLKAPVYNPKTKKWGAAKPIAYNAQSGFFHEWVQRLRASQPIGVPCTQERDWGDGRITQTFTSGRMFEFNKNDGALTVK